ncbi:hypothetical protein Tco_0985672 [Tanacetum coccineum]
MEEMCNTLSDKVGPMTVSTSSDLLKEALPRIVADVFKKERESSTAVNTVLNVHHTTSVSPATTTFDLQQQLYLKVKSDLQAQLDDPKLWDVLRGKFEKCSALAGSCKDDAFRKHDHEDHLGDDSPPKGRKATLRDMLSNQFRDAEEYTYHLEQSQNCMENQIVWESGQELLKRPRLNALVFYGPQRNPNKPPWYLYNNDLFLLKYGNTKEKRYVLSLHKIHDILFPKEYLEDSCHKRLYKIKHRKVRDDPEEVFSDYRIVETIKVTTDQQFGLDYMKRIIVMRENDRPDSFSKADFKYLNKNDIEDMYYICLNIKINHENKLLNSLFTFIRSCVIWERFHDFQLGIKSYQIKINLTTPTLIFPGIEECNPFSIVDKPTTCLIYLNNKNEKRFMDLEELSKFCDATLEKGVERSKDEDV